MRILTLEELALVTGGTCKCSKPQKVKTSKSTKIKSGTASSSGSKASKSSPKSKPDKGTCMPPV